MKWTDSFSIGVPEIDKQHMIIVECITMLEDAIKNRKQRAGWSTIHSVLGQLSAYVRMHFASEEELMRECGYPYLNAHMEEHLQFMQDLIDLQHKSRSEDIAHQLHAFLDAWWHSHVMEQDKDYVPFLKPRATGERAA